jgi:hypothetical protein
MKEDLLHNLELINTRIQNACEKAEEILMK